MRFSRVLWALCALCACAWAEDSRLVRIAQGPVRGHRSPEGGLFVFHNVPYATAPTGRNKFKAPLPPPTWSSPFDAVDRGIVCTQAVNSKIVNKTMQDDCLIANIYVPDTEQTKLPVVVLIHGGAYQIGYGEMITPKNFVKSKQIIYVNFNYRLGARGFLCLGTPDIPGNAGMKDQVAALKWVKENIANFGGNPKDITIQGFSAGSASVDLLLLSKSTRGLFSKAIPESGANVGTWAVQMDPLANAKEFASRHIKSDNLNMIDVLEEFYKTAPNELLYEDGFFNRIDNGMLFVPCVERDIGEERFLHDNPVSILKKGDYKKIPMLYGFTNMDGLIRVFNGYEVYSTGMNEKFSDHLPIDLQFQNETEKELIAKHVKEFYFGDQQIGEKTIMEYIDYFTDVMFAYPTLRSLSLQVEAGNHEVYLYEYGFPEDQLMPPGFSTKVQGAYHCAQTEAVMDAIGNEEEIDIDSDLKEMKDLMRELWSNFIISGSPVLAGSPLPAWPAAGAGGTPHMALALPPQLRGELLPRRARFWSDIYDKYYRAPVPPLEPVDIEV